MIILLSGRNERCTKICEVAGNCDKWQEEFVKPDMTFDIEK